MDNNTTIFLGRNTPDQIIKTFKENIHGTSDCVINILNDDVFGSFLPPNQIIDWMEILVKSEWDFNKNSQLFIDGIIKLDDSVVDYHPDINEYHDKLFKAFAKWIVDKLQFFTEEEKIAALINLSEFFGKYYDDEIPIL